MKNLHKKCIFREKKLGLKKAKRLCKNITKKKKSSFSNLFFQRIWQPINSSGMQSKPSSLTKIFIWMIIFRLMIKIKF